MEPITHQPAKLPNSAEPQSVFAGRVTRLIRLVNLLQGTERYTAEPLAKHIRVSRRTVFRDLKVLQGAGSHSSAAAVEATT